MKKDHHHCHHHNNNLASELETKLKKRALNDTINALEAFFSDEQVQKKFKLKDEDISTTDLKVYAFELNDYIANDYGCHFSDKAMIHAFLSEEIIPLNSSIAEKPLPRFTLRLGENLEPLKKLINGIYQEIQYQWLLYLASRLNLWKICLEIKSLELSKKGFKNKPLASPRTPRELMNILFSCRSPKASHPIMTLYKQLNNFEDTPRYYHNYLTEMATFYNKVRDFDPDNYENTMESFSVLGVVNRYKNQYIEELDGFDLDKLINDILFRENRITFGLLAEVYYSARYGRRGSITSLN